MNSRATPGGLTDFNIFSCFNEFRGHFKDKFGKHNNISRYIHIDIFKGNIDTHLKRYQGAYKSQRQTPCSVNLNF